MTGDRTRDDAARLSRTSPRDATPPRSRPSPGVRRAGCSTSTPTPTTTAASFTLAGAPGRARRRVLDGARAAIDAIELDAHDGVHPRVGAIDVAPIVYLDPDDRGAAAAEALVLADRLGEELGLPVFLYGTLGGGRTRAQLRRGGPAELARRIEAGELRPDFGPRAAAPDRRRRARRRAPAAGRLQRRARRRRTLDRGTRDRGRDPRGRDRRPAGRPRDRPVARERAATRRCRPTSRSYERASPADVVAAIVALAGGVRRSAELVGLAPAAAFEGFPATCRSPAVTRSRTRWPDAALNA